MRSLCIIVLVVSFKSLLSAQLKHDYIWIFAGNVDTMANVEGSIIDFNGDKTTTYYQDVPDKIHGENISFSSENGTLIAYANACDVFNNDFVIMENGADINSGPMHDEQCPLGGYLGLQNTLMLPDPAGGGIYYYHRRIEELEFNVFDWTLQAKHTLYSYIDIAENRVTVKNVPIHERTNHTSSFVEAIRHANGEDWWILDFSQWNNFEETVDDTLMYVFKIDKDSIYFHHEQKVGNSQVLKTRCSVSGQSAFSTDGKTFAMFCHESGLDLYDFDRETGLISNYRHLVIPSTYRTSGICFSPNNRFLYISNGDKLWQVDLEAVSLEDGLLLIDEYEPGPGLTANFAKMQLGPDCRIYMSSTNQTRTLHIINNPDEYGEACNFLQRGFELPYVCQPGSMPNFPHFRIDEDEVCNPDLVASVFEFPVKVVKGLDVYPNPTSGELTIELPEVMSGQLVITDITSQRLLSQFFSNAENFQVDLTGYHPGMYTVEVVGEDGERFMERVVVY